MKVPPFAEVTTPMGLPIQLHEITAEDVDFLKLMTYEAVRPSSGATATFESAMENPRNQRFFEHWGRDGDGGLLALTNESTIGAAWYRRYETPDPAWGSIDTTAFPTYEIAMAVGTDFRGKGVGRFLASNLIEHAILHKIPGLTFSTNKDNAAIMAGFSDYGFEITGQMPWLTIFTRSLTGSSSRLLS